MKVFRFYSDPGHGWLAVKERDLEDVGLSLSDITSFSYRNGKTVYLEEDCDYSTFYQAYMKKYGVGPSYIRKFTDRNHPIRSYNRV